MAKKTVKSNYRVAVYPVRGFGVWKDGEEERACKKMQAQIIRHVDGHTGAIGNQSQVFIEFDSEQVCEFCELPWETGDDGYPLCCDKASKEWENAQA